MLKFIPLTAADVLFTTRIEAEDFEPDFDDAETLADINERRNRGDVEAWCNVDVIATWVLHPHFTGRASVGGSSLDDTYTAQVCADEHGLQVQALDALNETIAAMVADLAPRLVNEDV